MAKGNTPSPKGTGGGGGAQAATQQQAQQAAQQAQQATTKVDYNYFTDTSKLPRQATNADVATLVDTFLSQKNIDNIASFIDNISDAEINMPSQTSQWIAAERMGFNAKPTLHDHVKSLAQSDPDRVVMYRGIFGDKQQGAEWAEEYKNGARFAGKGYLGDGDYFQLDYARAKYYASTPSVGAYSNSGGGTNGNVEGSIVVASFNPSKIKVITSKALERVCNEILDKLENKQDSGKISASEKKILALVSGNRVKNKKGTSKQFKSGHDGAMGTIATMLGYDAIYAKDEGGYANDYYVVLNRGILDVKKGY